MLIAQDNDTRAVLNTAAAREQLGTHGQLGDRVDYRPVTSPSATGSSASTTTTVPTSTDGTVLETRPHGSLIETDAGPLARCLVVVVALSRLVHPRGGVPLSG
jgi:hypothetical protein